MTRDAAEEGAATTRPGALSADQPCSECLAEPAAPSRRTLVGPPRVVPPRAWPPRAGRSVAFWLVAYLFAATMLGTTLPTPLYVIYQGQWRFSAGITTIIFATYAVGVLTALLLAGRSSDQVGRRPVLAVALGLSAVSRSMRRTPRCWCSRCTSACWPWPPLVLPSCPRPLPIASGSACASPASAYRRPAEASSSLPGLPGSPRSRCWGCAVVIGSLSTANRLAPSQIRGRAVSTYFVFCYVGLTIPVIGVGIASDYLGDFRPVLVCAIVLAVLSLLSMTIISRASLAR